ncbi:MAG: ribonuclease PH [Chloroflexi bacterium]|nr:MAG: ribonuclease PH [Chloroflexota bacterium]
MPRPDGRERPDVLRPFKLELGVSAHAEGSALVEMGRTRVWVTASVEDRVPPHRRGSGQGWVTAEYSMLPRATHDRGLREAVSGRIGGRTHEIQRLIGRSLRLDCDVLQADGGTRTAAITGAFAALYQAIRRMQQARVLSGNPLRTFVAAVSVGIIDGEARLDLDYAEDFLAHTDMNVVMADDGRFIELQATAEKEPLSRQQLDELLTLATRGIRELITHQKRAIAALG